MNSGVNRIGGVCALLILFGALSVAGQVPVGCEDCPPVGVQSSALSGGQTQAGHLDRDGVASSCPSKAFPGVVNGGTNYYYETFSYRNYGAAACVTVSFDPTVGGFPCGTNAQAAAYVGSYDPLDQSAGFLGDAGASAARVFSFEVPADSDFDVVVTNSAAESACNFSLEISDVACQTDTDVCEIVASSIPSSSPVGNLTLVLLLALGAGFLLRRGL